MYSTYWYVLYDNITIMDVQDIIDNEESLISDLFNQAVDHILDSRYWEPIKINKF